MSHNIDTIIGTLPRDIIRLICKELDILSIISLRLTCKGFKHALLPYVQGGREMCLEEIAIKTDEMLSTYFLDEHQRTIIKVRHGDIYNVYVSQMIRLGEITGHSRLYYMIACKQVIRGYSKYQCHTAIMDIYNPYSCPYINETAQKEIYEAYKLPIDEPWTPPESDNESDDEHENSS